MPRPRNHRTRPLDHFQALQLAQHRHARHRGAQEARQCAKAQEMRSRRLERAVAARGTAKCHLMRMIQAAARRPSLFTAKRLSAISGNSELPTAVRAEAARLLLSWANPPEDLDPTDGKRRRSPRRRN